jgi:heptosyltransferase III
LRRLIIRPGAIGDLIVSLPALEHLRAGYTEVWTAGPNIPLIRFADDTRSIASTSLDLLELGRAPQSLHTRLATFDSIVSWYGAGRQEFRDATAHLPIQFFPALPTDSALHATDFYLHQVGAPLGATPSITVPTVPNEGFVAIHPFSGSPRKNWPLENFQALAAQLEHVEWPVEFMAGPEESLPNARRFDDLYELACWLKRASLYIGNDSGITHLAAAIGIPTIALFGPTNPAVWAPRGSHVRLLHHDPINELSVGNVEQAVATATAPRRPR